MELTCHYCQGIISAPLMDAISVSNDDPNSYGVVTYTDEQNNLQGVHLLCMRKIMQFVTEAHYPGIGHMYGCERCGYSFDDPDIGLDTECPNCAAIGSWI